MFGRVSLHPFVHGVRGTWTRSKRTLDYGEIILLLFGIAATWSRLNTCRAGQVQREGIQPLFEGRLYIKSQYPRGLQRCIKPGLKCNTFLRAFGNVNPEVEKGGSSVNVPARGAEANVFMI
jgi:hypothetical protein